MSGCVLHVLMGLAAVCVSRAEVAHPPHPDCGPVYLQGLDVNSFPTATTMEGLFMKLSRQSSEEVTLYQHERKDLVAGLFSNGTFLVIDSTGKRLLEGNAAGEFQYYDPLLNQSVALSSTLPSSSPGTPESSHPTPQGLRLACADPSYHQCSTDRFQFTDVFYKAGSRIVREAFSLAPRTRNGLPLYRTASGLELTMDLAAGWQVRDESGVLLVSGSHASNPAYITSTWRERKGQGWQDAPGLRLACVPKLRSHNPPRNTCLNAAAASTHGPSLICLCRHGYGGVNCSEKLPACPALPQLPPGADGAYLLAPASPQPTHYPGDVLAVRCKDNPAPRSFVHVTCFRDAQGNVTWSNDVSCLVTPHLAKNFGGNSTAVEVDVGFTVGIAVGSAVGGFLVALAIVLVVFLAVRCLRKRKSPATDADDEGQRREQSEQVTMLDTSQV